MSSKMGNCGSSFSSSAELHGDWWKSSPSEYVFLRRFPSVTTHSTSSNLQFVHGMPLSTTSLRPSVSHHSRRCIWLSQLAQEGRAYQRTLRPRQQWQALEALRFTVLPPADKPAAEDFLFGEE
jgi:hypothetical protein